MSRYACVDGDNVVQQVVLWDGEANWSPPEGQTAVLLPDDDFFIEARGTLDTKTMEFVRYEPTPEELEQDRANAELVDTSAGVKKSAERFTALIDVLVEKGTLTPEDVAEVEQAHLDKSDG